MRKRVDEIPQACRSFCGLIAYVLFIFLGCHHAEQEKWTSYAADFRVISGFPHTFTPVDESRADKGSSDAILNLPDTDTSILNHPALGQYATSKAYGRIHLGGQWWGLIVLHGPGEASGSLTHFLIPYDTAYGKWGEALLLSDHFGECGYTYMESVIVMDSNRPTILQCSADIMIPNAFDGCEDLKPLGWSISAFEYVGHEPKRVQPPRDWKKYADKTSERVKELYYTGEWKSAFRMPGQSEFEQRW